MHEIKLRMQSCRRRGVSRERHTRSLAICRRGVIIIWGVTVGKANHNASNARGVTAGNMGRNSSIYNTRRVPIQRAAAVERHEIRIFKSIIMLLIIFLGFIKSKPC